MKKASSIIKSAVLVNNKKIKALKPILKRWIEINQEYCDAYPGEDCPYWYNERAAVSILAGAVWKSGGIDLEEFNSNKKYGRSLYLGRADLWFSLGKKRQDYLIEAKYDRFSLFSNFSKLQKRIINNVQSALVDAKNSKEEASLMLGVTFLVPYIPPSAQDNEKKMLADFFRLLKGMQMNLLAVYVNPYVMKDEEYGYSYPCIAIVGDVVS